MKTTLALLLGAIEGVCITYVVMQMKANEELNRQNKILEREIELTDEAIRMTAHYAKKCGVNLDERVIEAELMKRYNTRHK